MIRINKKCQSTHGKSEKKQDEVEMDLHNPKGWADNVDKDLIKKQITEADFLRLLTERGIALGNDMKRTYQITSLESRMLSVLEKERIDHKRLKELIEFEQKFQEHEQNQNQQNIVLQECASVPNSAIPSPQRNKITLIPSSP